MEDCPAQCQMSGKFAADINYMEELSRLNVKLRRNIVMVCFVLIVGRCFAQGGDLPVPSMSKDELTRVRRVVIYYIPFSTATSSRISSGDIYRYCWLKVEFRDSLAFVEVERLRRALDASHPRFTDSKNYHPDIRCRIDVLDAADLIIKSILLDRFDQGYIGEIPFAYESSLREDIAGSIGLLVPASDSRSRE